MADITSEGEGEAGAWNGASGREGALTQGKNIRRKGKKKEGNKRGSTSVVAVRNLNQSSSGDNMQAGTESRRGQEQHGHDQLLPGLPDEVTLDLITTKLSWTDFLVLSSISHAWRHAVHTRQVYEARTRAQVTASLYLFLHDVDGIRRMGVYSRGDKPCYRILPSVISREGWILSLHHGWYPDAYPSRDSLFARDGIIYVSGAVFKRRSISRRIYNWPFHRRMYCLDLAGRKQWTECSNDQFPPRLCKSFPYPRCSCGHLCSALAI